MLHVSEFGELGVLVIWEEEGGARGWRGTGREGRGRSLFFLASTILLMHTVHCCNHKITRHETEACFPRV